jgi:hypothetical protein
VPPLLRALRYADAFYNDWALDLLPSIFGSAGADVEDALRSLAADRGEHFLVRTVAMEGLASAATRGTIAATDIFPKIADIFADVSEPRAVRRGAGVILVDFKRVDMKDALTGFAREEQAILDYDAAYPAAFLPDDLKAAFSIPEPETAFYTADWMSFYRQTEIDKRQERWKREDVHGVKVSADAAKFPEAHGLQGGSSHGARSYLRDGPCPCGSGKKYRNCCMGKVH